MMARHPHEKIGFSQTPRSRRVEDPHAKTGFDRTKKSLLD
jgi:hypothetical protein